MRYPPAHKQATRRRILDAFQKDTLDLVLADRSDFEYTFMDSSGVHHAPLARFDLRVPLPPALTHGNGGGAYKAGAAITASVVPAEPSGSAG